MLPSGYIAAFAFRIRHKYRPMVLNTQPGEGLTNSSRSLIPESFQRGFIALLAPLVRLLTR
jgi:hypothetical protein